MVKRLTVLFLALGITITIIAVVFSSLKSEEQTEADLPVNAEQTITTQQEGYVIKLQNNMLCVFKLGENEPYREFEISIGTMTEYDKEMLISGIKASTEEKMWGIIEDYTS